MNPLRTERTPRRGAETMNWYMPTVSCQTGAQRDPAAQGGGMSIATRRSTRSGCSSATRHELHPPQSWPTRVARSIPSASSRARRSAASPCFR